MDEYLDLSQEELATKGIVIAVNILPLPQTDTTWNFLTRTIPQSSFVRSAIYGKSKPQTDPKKKEQEQQITHGFALKVCDDHPEVAKAAGLFFTDRTAKKGEQYIYRIQFTKPFSANSSPGIVSADEKLSVMNAVDKPSAQFRNRSMRMTFGVTATRAQYAGYIIERSDDSIHFARINTEILSFVKSQYETEKHELVYEDSIPSNGKIYWYRVLGYSYFGMTGPPSQSVHGKGKDEWNAYPIPDSVYSPDNKRVIIDWSIPLLNDPSQLKGVVVLRNDKVNGYYTPLTRAPLQRDQFSFTDTAAKFTNYYMLAAISVVNDTAFSYPVLAQLQDNDPPAIPSNIKGIIDTNGIVRISWDAVNNPDLKGYRVFRCNTLKEEFVEVSDSVIHQTLFVDTVTLQTLTRDVYYSVRSVDRVWNNSDYSTPFKLKRPDKIAPVSPLVKAIYHTDSTIVLQWINSTSDDIAMKKLVRKSSSEKLALKSFSGADTTTTFIDLSAEPGIIYSYELTIVDSSNNTTVLTFPALNFSPRVRPSLQHFTAVPNLEKRTITLKWDLPSSPVDRFIIYKGKEEESVRSFKTLSGTTSVYIDNQLYTGSYYTYRIRALLKDGSETKMVEVKVQF